MPIHTRLSRFFSRDASEVDRFFEREEKYRRRPRPDGDIDRGPDADRLRYEIFRARI